MPQIIQKISLGLILALGLGFSAAVPQARAQSTEVTELGSVMKNMKTVYQKISIQIKNPANNSATAPLCDDLEALARKSKDLIPAILTSLPEAQRAEQLSLYQAKMDELISQIEALKTALLTLDQSGVLTSFNAITATMKSGHNDFRE